MWGALPYLLNEYPHLLAAEASAILIYWMTTFGERHK